MTPNMPPQSRQQQMQPQQGYRQTHPYHQQPQHQLQQLQQQPQHGVNTNNVMAYHNQYNQHHPQQQMQQLQAPHRQQQQQQQPVIVAHQGAPQQVVQYHQLQHGGAPHYHHMPQASATTPPLPQQAVTSTPAPAPPSAPLLPHPRSNKWCHFPREILEAVYQKSGNVKEEIALRRSTCAFLQEAGMALKFPQNTIATAIVYFHRFFARVSILSYDRYSLAISALFLAGKVEETTSKLKDVVCSTYRMLHKTDLKVNSAEFVEERDKILSTEQLLLQRLAFDLTVDHPYKTLMKYVKKINGNRQLAQVAWNFINDSLRTTLCLQFPSQHIATAALYLASRVLGIDLSHGRELTSLFDCPIEQLDDISEQILALYDEYPNKSNQGRISGSPHTPPKSPTPHGKPELSPSTNDTSHHSSTHSLATPDAGSPIPTPAKVSPNSGDAHVNRSPTHPSSLQTQTIKQEPATIIKTEVKTEPVTLTTDSIIKKEPPNIKQEYEPIKQENTLIKPEHTHAPSLTNTNTLTLPQMPLAESKVKVETLQQGNQSTTIAPQTDMYMQSSVPAHSQIPTPYGIPQPPQGAAAPKLPPVPPSTAPPPPPPLPPLPLVTAPRAPPTSPMSPGPCNLSETSSSNQNDKITSGTSRPTEDASGAASSSSASLPVSSTASTGETQASDGKERHHSHSHERERTSRDRDCRDHRDHRSDKRDYAHREYRDHRSYGDYRDHRDHRTDRYRENPRGRDGYRDRGREKENYDRDRGRDRDKEHEHHENRDKSKSSSVEPSSIPAPPTPPPPTVAPPPPSETSTTPATTKQPADHRFHPY
ncbi:cyclin family protein [Pelomyxa schiedti]|nr:cyclin family protein [Pelomyxa schiedti]